MTFRPPITLLPYHVLPLRLERDSPCVVACCGALMRCSGTEPPGPAQIDLYATNGEEYNFQFMAKGGGSANKTFLFQQTKAVLNEKGERLIHHGTRPNLVGLQKMDLFDSPLWLTETV